MLNLVILHFALHITPEKLCDLEIKQKLITKMGVLSCGTNIKNYWIEAAEKVHI